MTKIDYEWVRAQFPILNQQNDSDFVFFDNAGGTFPCKQSNDISAEFYNHHKMQPYGMTEPQAEAGRMMDTGRSKMADLLGLKISDLTFGASTTQNFNNLANGMVDYIEQGDEIIVSQQDHEANIGCWERLAQLKGAKLLFWAVDDLGELHLDDLKKLLSEHTKLVSFTHCSNIIGSVNDVNAIAELVKAQCPQKPVVIADGVAYAPHSLPDIESLNVDCYCFSSYKTFGTHLSIMYTSERLQKLARPQCHFFNVGVNNYSIFDAAGPNHAALASLAGIADYYEAFARHHGLNDYKNLQQAQQYACKIIQKSEEILVEKLLALLATKQVKIYGKSDINGRNAIVSFTAKGMTSKNIMDALGAKNIGVKCGHFYAYRLIEVLGFDDLSDGVLRISYGHYLNEQDNGRLITALDEILPSK